MHDGCVIVCLSQENIERFFCLPKRGQIFQSDFVLSHCDFNNKKKVYRNIIVGITDAVIITDGEIIVVMMHDVLMKIGIDDK